ncbi:MAG: RNA polymerase sigma factor [Ginsengibacter sp.]
MSKDKKLFKTLHTDYSGMVFQMCLGYMKGDHDLAEDLSQEVFINIWSALNSFRQASSYKTWIYRITVNTCLKYIRDKKDSYQDSIDENSVLVADETDHSQDRQQLLYKAIGQLKEVERLIIMLVLDELEYGEISKIIGINEGNLRVRIHRIKKEIKKILNNEY